MDTQGQETNSTEPQISQTETVYTPELEKPKKDSNLIVVASLGLFVIAALTTVMFLFNQNQKLKRMLADYQVQPSPTPTATADPTLSWEIYTNDYYDYSFMHPDTMVLEYKKPGNGYVSAQSDTRDFEIRLPEIAGEYVNVAASDYFAPKINLSQWEAIEAEVNGQKIEAYRNKNMTTETNKLLYRFKNQNKETQIDFILNYNSDKSELLDTFLQILPTFKFTEDGGTACTQEAKLCSDGSYVGRVGPSCEFAACP